MPVDRHRVGADGAGPQRRLEEGQIVSQVQAHAVPGPDSQTFEAGGGPSSPQRYLIRAEPPLAAGENRHG